MERENGHVGIIERALETIDLALPSDEAGQAGNIEAVCECVGFAHGALAPERR